MNRNRFQPYRAPKMRRAVRVDLRRAAVTFSGVTSALAVALVFATRDQADKNPRIGFGWEWRTGLIMVVPAAGDVCRQSVFDNDTGAIWPAAAVSCEDVLISPEKKANAEMSRVAAISQDFRR
jgi:hypothetical protein